jgi:hypothetical protein
MSHEPECIYAPDPYNVGQDSCWVCIGIRAAYQRGREDAATNAGAKWLEIASPLGPRHHIARLIADAARGDGGA